MLGSPCSPCCKSCSLPQEIPARFSWNYSAAASYRWNPTFESSGGYAQCTNTVFPYTTPASLFYGTPYGSGSFTLTPTTVSASGTIRDYAYSSAVTLSNCCSESDWNAWVEKIPGWQSDNPTWKRLGFSVTLAYSAQVTFYAKEYPFLSPQFSSAISVIESRGDVLPGEACGLARGRAFLAAHVKYENGECARYDAAFQIKGSGSFTGVPYPEETPPWLGDSGFVNGEQEKIRYVAYGVSGGAAWLSSDLELQASGSSAVQQIQGGSYIYAAGQNTLRLL